MLRTRQTSLVAARWGWWVAALPAHRGHPVVDGVDPSDHFERRHAKPDMPPLVDTWRIDTISMQTAPFGEISVLDCVRMDVPPKRTSATAA